MIKITYDYKTVPHDKEVWACAFDIRNDGSYHALLAKPYRCKVAGCNFGDYYDDVKAIPLKSNSSEKMKSGIVCASARKYADTYNECVEIFNSLIKDKQDKMRKVIENWNVYYIPQKEVSK